MDREFRMKINILLALTAMSMFTLSLTACSTTQEGFNQQNPVQHSQQHNKRNDYSYTQNRIIAAGGYISGAIDGS